MTMTISVSTAASLVLALLAASPSMGKEPDPPLQEFTGRLEFWGEFTLFPFPASSGRAKECISGAFPYRQHVRAKRLYRGKSVRIRGWLVPYSSLVDQVGATELGWQGSPIPNYCG